MTIVHRMRETYGGAEIEDCREKTKIRIDNKKDTVIFKGELLVSGPHTPKICDCIIFNEKMKVAIVELKSRTSGRSSLLEKFCNTGEKFCEMIKPSKPSDFKIYLILVAKSYAPSTIKMCRNNSIRIGGIPHCIMTKRDNVCLDEIVKI